MNENKDEMSIECKRFLGFIWVTLMSLAIYAIIYQVVIIVENGKHMKHDIGEKVYVKSINSRHYIAGKNKYAGKYEIRLANGSTINVSYKEISE